MNIEIGNVKKSKRGHYIGRACYGMAGSALANPFAITKSQTRELAISRYEKWLTAKIAARDARVLAELSQIAEEARAGSVTLLCWCAPLACHGSVIARELERRT